MKDKILSCPTLLNDEILSLSMANYQLSNDMYYCPTKWILYFIISNSNNFNEIKPCEVSFDTFYFEHSRIVPHSFL